MLLARNKKAKMSYEVLEKFVAGIVLKGYETKALREGTASFEGAYIKMIEGRPYLVSMHIGRYSKQSQDVDDINQKRDRALLLNKNEILKLEQALTQKGKTAIPLAFVLKNNMIKLELGIVKGRKKHEKKHLEKEKQVQKDLEKYNSEIRRTI